MKTAWILLASLSLLSGCATAGVASRDLAGSAWRFTAIDGAAPLSDKAKLTFETDRLGATVGCNGMGGGWRISDVKLIAGPLIGTKMYCEALDAQERAVAELLGASPALSVNADTMTLTSANHSASLQRAP